MHHYPFHPGDYTLDTAHLEPMEDLTYRKLLDMYYDSEAPIPLETQQVSRRLRLGSDIVEKVLNEFFEKRETGWHQDRCDMEIDKYNRRVEASKSNGCKGGRPTKTKGKPRKTQQVTTRTKNQEPDSTPSPPMGDAEIRLEVGSWFNRKATTPWSEKENKAWKKLQPIDPEQLASLRWYYTESGCRFLRKDLQTLLNNWQGEVDRSLGYDPKHDGSLL